MADIAIWKFPIAVADEQEIEMPMDARILCVQVQHETPCIWAVCLATNPSEKRRFRTFGTGHPAEWATFGDPYIGTYQLRGGALVFHVFEVKDKKP